MGIQVQPCCCGDCTILSDSFSRPDDTDLGADWDEDSGSWAIASGHLETTSSNATILTVAANPDNFRGKVTGTFVQDNLVTGDEVKLLVSSADATNTFYAIFKAANSLGVGGTAKMYDSGGTQQGNTITLSSFRAGVSGSSTFSLCFNGTTLIVNTADGNESANTGTFGYGDLAGIGTGTVAGTVEVTSFTYSKYQTDGDSCPTCATPCDLVCTTVPAQWKIEWADMIQANSECTDCFDLDSGTVYLDFLNYISGIPACNWGPEYLPDSLLASCDVLASDCILAGTPAGFIEVYWTCGVTKSGANYYLQAQFNIGCNLGGSSSYSASVLFQKDLGTTKPDCASLTTPQDLTLVSIFYETGDDTTPQTCDLSPSATCTLTAVP